jgi:hypothetical protein
MRKSLTLLFAWVLCAGSASADHIGLYRDPIGYYCALQNPPVGPPGFSLYVVHKFNAGATGSQFKVEDASGFFPTTQSTITGVSLGTWNTDWSIAYGACLSGDVPVATLNFMYFGTPPLLCAHWMRITPAPTSAIPGSVITVNCSQGVEPASSAGIWFGPGAISGPHGECWCATVATREATWGSVKALYR